MALDFTPGLSPQANAEDLYQRFHTRMEARAPGCFRDGRITHLGYVDGARPPSPEVDLHNEDPFPWNE